MSVVQPAPVLLGFSQLDYGSRGFISNPIISDINESLLAELRDLGLKQMDARAVVFAVTTECDYFVTHDTRDLLPHRDAIEAKRQIRIVKPTEFLPEWMSRA